MAYRLIRTLTAAALALGLGGPALAQDQPPSAYGCSYLGDDPLMPIFEGTDGVFYRIYSDLRMYHPFSDTTVELLGQLSDVLRENGTTLVFLPVPTKSQVMQEYMTDRAELYGFDHGIATAVYADIVDRLNTRGVITIDGQEALRQGIRRTGRSSAPISTGPPRGRGARRLPSIRNWSVRTFMTV